MNKPKDLLSIYHKMRIGMIRDEMIIRKINRNDTPEDVIKRLERNLRQKQLRDNNIQIKIGDRLRTSLYNSLLGVKRKKERRTFEYLGCSINDFIFYIEGKFKDGMCWENYGDWHLDHIEPVCSFDLTDEAQIFICFNYTNFQPLWAKENRRKISSDKRKSKRF